jgi:hypothetical protein
MRRFILVSEEFEDTTITVIIWTIITIDFVLLCFLLAE